MTEREELMEEYALDENEMGIIEEIAENNGSDLWEAVSNFVQCKWDNEEPDR